MFDPFGDFESEGYLRNKFKIKNLNVIARLERVEFEQNIYLSLKYLDIQDSITIKSVCEVHRILFHRIYPWAGQTRDELIKFKEISKEGYGQLFANTGTVNGALHYALEWSNDPYKMREEPGTIMGMLAYSHPFLDCNGRTIMAVHSNLCRRAGLHIAWNETTRSEYLENLTKELQSPNQGILNNFMEPFIYKGARSLKDAIRAITSIQGLSKTDQEIQREELRREKE